MQQTEKMIDIVSHCTKITIIQRINHLFQFSTLTAPSTHSLTAALDQLRVVASSTSNDPGPRSRQHQQIARPTNFFILFHHL